MVIYLEELRVLFDFIKQHSEFDVTAECRQICNVFEDAEMQTDSKFGHSEFVQ